MPDEPTEPSGADDPRPEHHDPGAAAWPSGGTGDPLAPREGPERAAATPTPTPAPQPSRPDPHGAAAPTGGPGTDPGPYAAPGGPYAPATPPYGAPANPYAPPGGYGVPGGYGAPGGAPPGPPFGGPGTPYGPSGSYGVPGYPYAWPYIPSAPKAPPSPEARRARRRWVIALAAVLVVALGGGVGIGAAIAPTSPSAVATSLLHRSMAAAAGTGSFHYVEISTVLGAPDDITGDALPHGGRQVITQRCKSGTNVFDLRLVHGVVYFRGNEYAVLDQLGVATTRAGSLVNRWVKLTKSETPYKSFAAGITAQSNISQLPTVIVPRSTRAVPGASPPATQIVGALYAGKGKSPIGTAALNVDASSSLPQTLRGSAVSTSGRFEVSWTFSHFGQHVSVGAPPGAVAYASLHAKAPAKATCV